MRIGRGMWIAVAVMAAGAGVALPAQQARAPGLVALANVEQGAWELHEIGRPRAPRLCVSDVSELLQLRHRGGAGCSRFVIANQPREATIHYTCPGAGHGRTVVAVETPRIVRVETAGIANDAPFDLRMEARSVDRCPAR